MRVIGFLQPNNSEFGEIAKYLARQPQFYLNKDYFWQKNTIFVHRKNDKHMGNKHLNCIKIVLAEKEKSNKWLSEQLGKDQGIISKWVTNTT